MVIVLTLIDPVVVLTLINHLQKYDFSDPLFVSSFIQSPSTTKADIKKESSVSLNACHY